MAFKYSFATPKKSFQKPTTDSQKMIDPIERDRRFLRSLWQNRLFRSEGLALADGTPVEVVNIGIGNDTNERLPDFSFASIKYLESGVTMYGNIKIDVCSSHWRAQGTIAAAELSSVILHVVFYQDIILSRFDRDIPTLVLTPLPTVAATYDELRKGSLCPTFLGGLEDVHRNHLLTRIMSDRLRRKSDEIIAIYNSVEKNWHETAYIALMRAFGFKQQKSNLEKLARSLPYRYLRVAGGTDEDVFALLLGQAGFLSMPPHDGFVSEVQRRYYALQKRLGLYPTHISWQGGHTRPASLSPFLVICIATILVREQRFLERVLACENLNSFLEVFDILVDEKYLKHFAPSVNSRGVSVERSQKLIINFVIPFLTAYGILLGRDELRDRALDLYESLPAEVYGYTKRWAAGGYQAPNAFFSQALVQLSSEQCDDGICGDCPLGVMAMKNFS